MTSKLTEVEYDLVCKNFDDAEYWARGVCEELGLKEIAVDSLKAALHQVAICALGVSRLEAEVLRLGEYVDVLEDRLYELEH